MKLAPIRMAVPEISYNYEVILEVLYLSGWFFKLKTYFITYILIYNESIIYDYIIKLQKKQSSQSAKSYGTDF